MCNIQSTWCDEKPLFVEQTSYCCWVQWLRLQQTMRYVGVLICDDKARTVHSEHIMETELEIQSELEKVGTLNKIISICINLFWHISMLFCLCLQTCQVGLNFASEEETKRFRGHVAELMGRRQRKTGTSWWFAYEPTYWTNSLKKMTCLAKLIRVMIESCHSGLTGVDTKSNQCLFMSFFFYSTVKTELGKKCLHFNCEVLRIFCLGLFKSSSYFFLTCYNLLLW